MQGNSVVRLKNVLKEQISKGFKVLSNPSVRDKQQDTTFPEDVVSALILKCLSYFLIRFHLERYFHEFSFLESGTNASQKLSKEYHHSIHDY